MLPITWSVASTVRILQFSNRQCESMTMSVVHSFHCWHSLSSSSGIIFTTAAVKALTGRKTICQRFTAFLYHSNLMHFKSYKIFTKLKNLYLINIVFNG